MKKEYKIVTIEEGALGTIFLGASKIPIMKMEETLNQYGQEGWDVEFQLIEQKRLALFWKRESVVITLSREL